MESICFLYQVPNIEMDMSTEDKLDQRIITGNVKQY